MRLTELQSLFDIQGTGTRLLILLVLVFGCVFLVSIAAMRAYVERAAVRRRTNPASPAIGPSPDGLRAQEGLRASDMLARVGKFLAPNDAESYSQSRRELIKAGFFSPSAVAAFHAVRVIFGFGLPLSVLMAVAVFPLGISGTEVPVAVIFSAAAGFIAPSFYLRHRQKKMQLQYRSGFPDFMDLLVVCVESGLALQPSIDRISREIAPTTPQLAANLHLVGLELRAGSSLGDALDGLTQRLGIEEAFSLASLLKQSEELGTSLSDALRVYSDEMRDKRLSRAETMAHALPVKITFPVGVCIFPVILVIVFLPLLIRIKQVLSY